ncbi:2-oxo acid dehydrogenase subunit E2 [Hyphococcus formosus]|uniref:2-oxo acid dehydrogenase subunit E2 n=1 Tax=Hyphococcus formosus TaxID=3143534 RepID=UPI00398B115E
MAQSRIIRFSGVRGMIASKMHASLSEGAQLTYCAEVDASSLVKVRRDLNESADTKIGFEDVIIHALGSVFKDHPLLNGVIKDGAAYLSDNVNISVAVDIETGLVAPTVFDIQSKTITQISEARKELLERARKGKLTVPEMTGGSFTISNLGLTRVQFFTPIINAPQIAMLGFGRIEMKPVANAKEDVVIRPMMGVSLTADHRVVDGAPAGRFLTDFCTAIENLA